MSDPQTRGRKKGKKNYMGFGNFEACTQYHTSSSKASPFNPSQVVPLARTIQYIPIHEPFSFRPPRSMTSINPQSNPSYMRQTFRGIPIWQGIVNLGEVESHTYNHPVCIWGKEDVNLMAAGCQLTWLKFQSCLLGALQPWEITLPTVSPPFTAAKTDYLAVTSEGSN